MSGWARRIKLGAVPGPALCGGGRLDRCAPSAALSAPPRIARGTSSLLGTWLDEIAHSLEVDDQIARHRPLLLPGEDAGEVLVAPQRPVGVVGLFRRAP